MSKETTLPALSAGPIPAPIIDGSIALAVLVGSIFLLSPDVATLTTGPVAKLDWPAGLLVACASLPLAGWRRAPLGVFIVTLAASSVLAALGYSLGLALGPAVALYLLASSRDARRPWTVATTVVVVAGLVVFLAATAWAKQELPRLEILHHALVWAVAWFAGERTRLGRERIAQLHERAERAEREAEQDRRLAIAEERARLARDLHDSAGHAINVIVVRAGAARLRHDEDPERSRAALETIESVARSTAEEIDQIVSALREASTGDEPVEAPHGLASLDTLIVQHAAAGLEVDVETTGTPRPLGANVDQAAYRILQEALTNASRHGQGTAHVDLDYGERRLELVVANPVSPTTAQRRDGGHGLVGMRERAQLVGGDLRAERINGTFSVQAQLAYEGRQR